MEIYAGVLTMVLQLVICMLCFNERSNFRKKRYKVKNSKIVYPYLLFR
jgi:hypothetical protein